MSFLTTMTFLVLEGFKETLKGVYEVVNGYITMVNEYIKAFISNDANIVLIGALLALIVILLIAGLIGMLKKAPKLFVFVLVLLGAFIGLWYLANM